MSRFNFVVDDDAGLNELVLLTKRSSKADVVRDALSLYQYLVRRVRRGDRIYVGSSPTNLTEVAVTSLENVRESETASSYR